MKLHLINRERLQSLGSFLVDEFDSLVARIRAAWKVEHTDDGRHGHVHAESVASGRLVFSDIVSASVESNQDNFDPGIDTVAILRLNSTQSEVTISGLKVPQDENGVVLDGRLLVLENISTAGTVFRLPDEDDASFPRNRIRIPRGPATGGADATNVFYLHPSSLLALIYNSTQARWVVQSQSNENAIGYTTFDANQDDLQVTTSYRTLRTWRLDASVASLTVSGFLSTNIPPTERKTVVNDGLFTIAILHANTGSDEANRVYCPGGVRYLLHPRESVELQRVSGGGWRILEKADQWVDVAFDAGTFTTDTGTWAVAEADQITLASQLDGNKMTVSFDIQTTTVATNPTQLRIAVPNGRTIARTMQNPVLAINAGTQIGTAYVEAIAGQTYLRIFRDLAATAWSAATDTTSVRGQITFMVRDDCAAISELHTDAAHGDTAHSDVEHSDAAHSDVAHGDLHADSAHSDAAHSDTAHVDTHSDVSHSDIAHSDAHSDVAHSDVAHSDAPHTDIPADPGKGEPHDDAPHEDVAHSDVAHSDVAHSDVAHSDVAHSDAHSDTAHSDTAHVDTGHSDSHSDTVPHSDVAHIDVSHGDTPHADEVHEDVGYHCDTSHADQ